MAKDGLKKKKKKKNKNGKDILYSSLTPYVSLYEVAVSPRDLNSNYCLYVELNGQTNYVVLFDSTNIFSPTGEVKPEGIIGYGKFVYSPSSEISDNPFSCFEVVYTAARQGYGPLIYDVMLAEAGKKGLMADRHQVSPDAENVWEYYFKNRKSEIIRKPIDDYTNPITPEVEDDGVVRYPTTGKSFKNRHPTDWVYYFKNPLSIKRTYITLQNNYEIFINKNFLPKSGFNDLLLNSATDFFERKIYKRITQN